MMSIVNSIKEKLRPQDVKEVDKRTRQSEPLKPPGTGNIIIIIIIIAVIILSKEVPKSMRQSPLIHGHILYHYPLGVFHFCQINSIQCTPQFCT